MTRPAALLLSGLLLCPAPLRADGTPPAPAPAREWKDYQPDQLLEEISKVQSRDGTYGQAYETLGRIYAADKEEKGAKLEALRKFLTERPGPLNEALGGQTIAKLTMEGLLANDANKPVLALLLDANARPATRQALLAYFDKLKADGTVKDFDDFVRMLGKDARDGAVKLEDKLVHKILTGIQDPTAPEDRRGEERRDERDAGRDSRGRAAEAARGYWSADEIYGKLGEPNVVTIGGRVIAFNIVTVKDDSGAMTQKVAVTDRTNPSDVFGWTFALDDPRLRKGFTFRLDDRPGSVDKTQYTLQLVPSGNDMKLAFAGADGKAAPVPTVNELFRQRAEKVRRQGVVVKVGDKEFYLGGEGHSGIGQNTFWTKEMLDKLSDPSFDPKNLVPQLASVAVKREGGRDVPVARSSIGQVGGQWYDLRWNPERGEMEVVKGLPPEGGAGGGEDFAHPGLEAGGKGGLDGWPDMSDRGLFPAAYFDGQLSAAARAKARIYFKPGSNSQVYIVLDKNAEKNYPLDLARIRIVPDEAGGHVLAWRMPEREELTFLDLLKPLDVAAEGKGVVLRFEKAIVGTFNPKAQAFSGIKGRGLSRFVLGLAGFQAREVEDMLGGIPGNADFQLDNRMPDGARGRTVHLAYNRRLFTWKGDKWEEDKGGQEVPGGAGDIAGKEGTVMDRGNLRTPGTVDEKVPFPAEISGVPIPGAEGLFTAAPVALSNQSPTARLYHATSGESDAAKKKQVWTIVAHLVSGDGKTKRQVRFPAFGKPAGEKLLAYPEAAVENLRVQGISFTGDLPKMDGWEIAWRRAGGEPFEKKGVIFVVDAPTANKYDNFVGVLAYWGMSAAEAEALAKRKSS